MIAERYVKSFVRKGELEKIENYDKAVADKTQTWVCHHRLELTLDGEFAHSREDLKRMGMYHNRPYFELILITKGEHSRLHGKAQSEETKRKWLEANKGKHHSEETKKKISEAKKGRKKGEEFGKKMSKILSGRKPSEELRKKWSEIRKNKPRSEFGKKYLEHFGYLRSENKIQYYREQVWYRRHGKCSWEE